MSRFPSPFRSSREAAEESLHAERRKHESLESELEAVRRQLAAVRSNLGGTPAAATPHAAASAWAAAAPTPYGAAAHTPSYSALARGLGSGAAREPGVESYYIARLRKLLGPKADIHNLLDHPGVTIEEAFGAVLAASAEDGAVPWIVTDDSWSHDLHKSHYHNILETAGQSGKEINVNLLVLTSPGAGPGAQDGKKDAALYAMQYGCAYVAAVSHRLDNTRLVASLRAASEFAGPSVITAPATADKLAAMTNSDDDAPVHYTWDPTQPAGSRLHVADECRAGILDPKFVEGEENLSLLLKQLGRPAEPSEERTLEHAMAERVADVNRVDENKVITVFFGSESPGKNGKFVAEDLCQKIRTKGFFVDGGGPISLDTVLGHDRLTAAVEEGGPRKKAIVVISTAGVGEFPDGGKGFVKEAFGPKIEHDYEDQALLIGQSELDLSNVDFAVFGLGDTNYHPAEKHLVDSYGSPWTYCTPAKIAQRLFDSCGAKPLCDIGFGDDSEMGGFNAGYERWSDALWAALADGATDVAPAAKTGDAGPKVDPNEYIKLGSDALKQPMLNDLMDPTNDINIQGDSAQISKHHGIYQQKLRDYDIITDEEKANPFSFMVRVRLPGGDCTPAQMKGMLDICDSLGNSTVKITTRQTFQLHGIQKKGLIESINQINKYAMDTIAACGDVNRNVMSTVVRYPTTDARDPNLARYERTMMQCNEVAKEVSIHLLPEGLCNTYHEIWVNRGRPNHADEQYKKKNQVYVKGNALKYRPDGTIDFAHEPVLKERYLPRKFKIAISIPPFNDTDVFAHDIGFIAISDASGDLLGFNVSIGGGLGATRHGLTKAYPRLGDIIGFCSRADTSWVAQKIMEVQRDHGYRSDRTHARLKYTVEDHGVEFFVSEINRRMSQDEDCRHLYPRGFSLQAALPFEFKDNKDTFGETVNSDGTHNFSIYMQNGRIKNFDEGFYTVSDGDGPLALKDMVYEVCELGTRHTAHARPPFHFVLTNNQNLIISHIQPAMRREVLAILDKHNVPLQHTDDTSTYSPLLKNAMACVALPTCGLAMAPAETYLPELLYKLGQVMDELDFTDDMKDIIVRMSGCPNGCSRMVLGEICFVGRSMEIDPNGKPLGIYDMSFGGNEQGTRLATMYKKGLNEEQILSEMRPILKEYKRYKEMRPSGRFGDFAIEHGLTRECKARPTLGKGAREPAITYHLSVTYRDEMVEEVAALAEANTDKLGDVLKSRYGIHDVRSVQW